jgi:membrane fusion protein (multidrug efflux system)
MRKLHFGIAIVGIVLAAAAAWWWQNRGPGATLSAPAGVAAVGTSSGTAAGAAAGGPNGGRQPGSAGGAPGGQAGGPGGGQGGGPVAVEVRLATVMTLEDDAQAVGNLQARQGVMLRPEVSGRVARIGFADGQPVKQGQVLIQFDDALQQAQLRQAQAQAAIAQTNLQRQRDLLAQNFISQSAVDQSAAAVEVAQAQVALTRAQLARMRLLAPFDGVAGIGNVDRGDYVREGADIVGIEDLSAMTVDFRLAERWSARVARGQPVEMLVDAMPGQRFEGKVQAIDSQLDANGRSVLVRATIDNPKRTLRSGMFARARVIFERRTGAVVVPEEALVPQGEKQFVIKVVDGPQGKMSKKVEAVLGVRTEGKVELLKDVAVGDAVVTAGHARLLARDGVALRVIELDRAGDPSSRRSPGANGGEQAGPSNGATVGAGRPEAAPPAAAASGATPPRP